MDNQMVPEDKENNQAAFSKQQVALEKFTKLFENNPAIMAVTDVQSGRFTEVSKGFLNKLGFLKEEILGKTNSALQLFPEPNAHAEAFHELMETGSLREIELTVRKKNGEALHGLFSGVILEHQGQKSLLTVGIDLTQQKEIEHELEETRANMKAMLDNQPYAAFLKDSRYRFIDVNRAFLESNGVSREDIIGKTDTAIWDEEFAQQLKAENEAVLNGGKQISREEWDRMGDRCYERLLAPVLGPDGTPVGITGFSRDITDRKRLERELQAQKAFLQQMLDSIPDLIFYKDINFNYLGANKAYAEEFVGIKQEELVGKSDYDITGDLAQAELFRRLDREFIEQGTPITSGSIRMADGRQINVETLKSAFYNQEGKIAGFIAIARDISNRIQTEERLKRSESALKAAKEELEQKNQSLMAAYDQLQIIASTDQLTKLMNRWSVLSLIEQEQVRFQRSRRPFSIIIADIDAFKSVNDTYGHNFGDHVIVYVAEILRTAVRAQDRAARWGGEEFLILLPETAIEGAVKLAEKLRCIIEESVIEKDGLSVRITMTFGVSTNDLEQDLSQLISKADKALYYGKENGKNQVNRA
jgi:diguanylate cyclase (GGDEF)-like protein/PAS domain S-box-containing protein